MSRSHLPPTLTTILRCVTEERKKPQKSCLRLDRHIDIEFTENDLSFSRTPRSYIRWPFIPSPSRSAARMGNNFRYNTHKTRLKHLSKRIGIKLLPVFQNKSFELGRCLCDALQGYGPILVPFSIPDIIQYYKREPAQVPWVLHNHR